MKKFVAIFAAAFCSLAAAPGHHWNIGQEREVDEGVYATLLTQKQGWWVWKFEDAEHTDCTAVKSARGTPAVPMGVADYIAAAAPYLQVSQYGWSNTPDQESWTLGGKWAGRADTKFRLPGERFWKSGSELAPSDAKVLEVDVTTYEYPSVYVGRSEDHGFISLSGLGAIRPALQKCAAEARERGKRLEAEWVEKVYRDLEARGIHVREK